MVGRDGEGDRGDGGGRRVCSGFCEKGKVGKAVSSLFPETKGKASVRQLAVNKKEGQGKRWWGTKRREGRDPLLGKMCSMSFGKVGKNWGRELGRNLSQKGTC